MDVQLPDGTMLQGVPDGTTKAQIVEKLQKNGRTVPPEWLQPKAAAAPGVGKELLGAADAGLSLATGAGASMLGGLAKAGGYANQALGIDSRDPVPTAEKIERGLTYQPRTDVGKALVGKVGKGLEAFEKWTEREGESARGAILAAGDKAGEVAKRLHAPQSVVDFIDKHKVEISAAYGAATKTGLNALPYVVGSAVKLPGLPKRVAGDEPLPASATPAGAPGELSVAPSPPRAAPTDVGARSAAPGGSPAAPLEAAPASPRGTPNTSLEGPPAASTPRARAETYARDRLGLRWNDMAEATRKKLESIAADAKALDRLNPEAVARQATLEGLRVPIKTTAGRLNRDNVQLLREEGAAATDAGRDIVRTDEEANAGLKANVETLIDRLRGVGQSRATASTREGVGEAVAGRGETPGALKLKEEKSQANIKRLYDQARKTQPNARVSADAMYDFVRGNPEVLNPQIQHLSWLNTWLKKAGIESEAPPHEGAPGGEPKVERRPIRLAELDDLRKRAVSEISNGGTGAHYAKEVLGAIDKTFDEVPDAASAWKAARKAYGEHQQEFTNREAIQRLVGKKGGAYGTDPKTALEDVWKVSVKNAKLEQIRQLQRSLMSGKDAETRLAGKKALRELRAETGRDLLREITKGVSTNSRGEVNITADSINRWINGMGGEEKLSVILGKRATNELMKIREAAQITKTHPTIRNVGSNTMPKILNWLDQFVPLSAVGHAITNIPHVGPYIGGAAQLAKRVGKEGETARTLKEAEETATSKEEARAAKEAPRAAKKADKRQAEIQRQQLRGARPPRLTLPPTYGDRQ